MVVEYLKEKVCDFASGASGYVSAGLGKLAKIILLNREEPHKVLQVEKDAKATEIRKAYLKVARNDHPDRNPDDPDATEAMKVVNEAYEKLMNPDTSSNDLHKPRQASKPKAPRTSMSPDQIYAHATFGQRYRMNAAMLSLALIMARLPKLSQEKCVGLIEMFQYVTESKHIGLKTFKLIFHHLTKWTDAFEEIADEDLADYYQVKTMVRKFHRHISSDFCNALFAQRLMDQGLSKSEFIMAMAKLQRLGKEFNAHTQNCCSYVLLSHEKFYSMAFGLPLDYKENHIHRRRERKEDCSNQRYGYNASSSSSGRGQNNFYREDQPSCDEHDKNGTWSRTNFASMKETEEMERIFNLHSKNGRTVNLSELQECFHFNEMACEHLLRKFDNDKKMAVNREEFYVLYQYVKFKNRSMKTIATFDGSSAMLLQPKAIRKELCDYKVPHDFSRNLIKKFSMSELQYYTDKKAQKCSSHLDMYVMVTSQLPLLSHNAKPFWSKSREEIIVDFDDFVTTIFESVL